MFGKEIEKNVSFQAETIIGPSIIVKGDFHGEGDMMIEGTVEGDIKTKEFVSVGTKARIIANIKAKNAKISGYIKGDVNIDDFIQISNTAIIDGNIICKELSIDKGATINGHISMQINAKPTVE
jgi:cytoskeletal protein CcmA (bactofilin family)